VSALTAAINASSKGAGSGSGGGGGGSTGIRNEISKTSSMLQQQMRSEGLNGSGSAIDLTHLSEAGLGETSDLQAKFKSEIQTKFPGKRFFFLSFFLYILL
jgi:hypothetical protein